MMMMVLLLSAAYMHITQKFTCDDTELHGPLSLVISDLHVHPYMPFLDSRMAHVVSLARRNWPMINRTIVLGDLMHWAGGLTFASKNLSSEHWNNMVARVKAVVNDSRAIYIPGNHDLNDTITDRWIRAFGAYNTNKHVFNNVTAYLASAMAPQRHNSTVVLSHYPMQSADDPLWHPKLQLALNGHLHYQEQRLFNGTRQYTLATLNPFQAISNNHFDGSGQQGFGLMDASLRIRTCQVYTIYPTP